MPSQFSRLIGCGHIQLYKHLFFNNSKKMFPAAPNWDTFMSYVNTLYSKTCRQSPRCVFCKVSRFSLKQKQPQINYVQCKIHNSYSHVMLSRLSCIFRHHDFTFTVIKNEIVVSEHTAYTYHWKAGVMDTASVFRMLVKWPMWAFTPWILFLKGCPKS